MNKISIIFISLTVFFCCFANVFATTTVEPKLFVSESFNDNIYLKSEDTESDFITTVAPGVDIDFDSMELIINLDYALNFKYYNKNSNEDENNFRDAQRALIDALVFPDRDFTLALREDIRRVVIDDRDQSVLENELVNSTTLYHFSANPQYRWNISSRFSVISEYRYDNYDYVAADGDDAATHYFGLGLEKDLVTDTNIRIKGSQEDYSADTRIDYRLQQGSGGMTQPFGPRWLLIAEGGHAWVDFDNGQKKEGSTWTADITGRIAKNYKLTLASNRAYFVSVGVGLIKRTQASLAIRFQDVFSSVLKTDVEQRTDIEQRINLRQRNDVVPRTDAEANILREQRAYIEVMTYWLEDRYQTEERIDRSFGSQVRSRISLSRKYALSLEGDIGQYEFLPDDENALRFGVACSLEYIGNHGSLSLGYAFRHNNSDIEENDFINNIATLAFSLRF